MNLNVKMTLPIVIEKLEYCAEKEDSHVLKSRLETLALLCKHIDNSKMWAAIMQEMP